MVEDANDVDLGLFGPGSVSWRVHREPILALAGLRALYLQALHPQAISGVAQNSRYREDPFGRLERTGTYVATVVFGTTAQANEAGRRIRALHSSMRATDPRTGEEFRIDDPHLLRWVHVTEAESFVTTARRAGLDLSDSDVNRYYDEQRAAAALVGLDPSTVPNTIEAVEDYYRAIRPELGLTQDSAAAAMFLSAPPLPWLLGLSPVRLAWLGLAGIAVGLLPTWARRIYGLPGVPTTDPVASVSARAIRLALRAVPEKVFRGPIYNDAMERAATYAGAAALAPER
jgi:uncharacterized protein (DUF2236 family)